MQKLSGIEMKKIVIFTVILFLSNCSHKVTIHKQGDPGTMLEKEMKDDGKVKYLLYLPESYQSSHKKWSLLLFLHGAGERGNDLQKVKLHGPPKLIEHGQQFPFIVVAPQCPEDQWWDIENLDKLLKDVTAEYRIDTTRQYLTGLSMGGYGTWALATEYPNRFAAIAPVCGGGDPSKVETIKHIPVWVFHGAKDEVVPIEKSQEMVAALTALGADVKFTVYPEAAHDSWTETYANPKLYEWFLKHKIQK